MGIQVISHSPSSFLILTSREGIAVVEVKGSTKITLLEEVSTVHPLSSVPLSRLSHFRGGLPDGRTAAMQPWKVPLPTGL